MDRVEKQNEYIKLHKRLTDEINEDFKRVFDGYEPDSLYEPCRYIMELGGKRLRPFLVFVSAKAAGANLSEVKNAAMAVELLHNFTLVHDDIMDNASKRRGKDTIHKKYGLNAAILSGDNLIAFAYKTLLKDAEKNPLPLMEIFTQGIIEVCEGQSLDTVFETQDEVSIEEYKEMIGKKTAALLEVCCRLGATAAGANEETLEALGSYGYNLGMAFQVHDDLLDIIADEKEFGKKTGGDLIEGKKTYLFLRALEKGNKEETDKLLKVIKNKGIDESEVDAYRELYKKLGVMEDTRREIEKYTKKALEAIDGKINDSSEGLLKWLAELLVKRSK